MTKLENEIAETFEVAKKILDAVANAKTKGLKPYWVMLNGFNFIYHPVTKQELKILTNDKKSVVKKCLIYSDILVDDDLGTGYVDTLFDVILVDSGFGQPDMPSINMN